MIRCNRVKAVQREVAREQTVAEHMAREIARLAEPGFEEFQSARLLMDYLRDRGFSIRCPWKHMPTAFEAVSGTGRPRVALLAEYDALPDCGLRPRTWGHGCGHNLLGVASAVAAVVATRLLARHGHRGQIVVWGCPAEELLAGKVYMARDGAFRHDDAVLCWHPSTRNEVQSAGGAALDSLLFDFHGRTAHAAAAEGGRSAIDGVMLLDVAANYLREHVPENVRIHMCVPHGGDAPNVVPARAQAWYYVRGRNRKQVDEVRKRLVACAQGAAMATGTRVVMTRLTGVYNRLPNEALHKALMKNLQRFGPNVSARRDRAALRRWGIQNPQFSEGISDSPPVSGRASTDADNVSWLTPMGGELRIACVSVGTRGHHRDYTAQVVLPFALAGMRRAAEIRAATAWEICRDQRLLARARQEFRQKTAGFRYAPLVRRDQPVPQAFGRFMPRMR